MHDVVVVEVAVVAEHLVVDLQALHRQVNIYLPPKAHLCNFEQKVHVTSHAESRVLHCLRLNQVFRFVLAHEALHVLYDQD